MSNWFSNLVGGRVITTVTGGGGGTSFIQCNNNNGSGQTLVINGEIYEQVTRVTLETVQRKKIKVDGEYGSVDIRVHGDCDRIDCASGIVNVDGDCKQYIKTMSGSVNVGGTCKGDVGTMSGSIDVAGNVRGAVKTMSGSIRHSLQKVLKVGKPAKVDKVAKKTVDHTEENKKKKKRVEEVSVTDDDDDDVVSKESPVKKKVKMES